MQQRVHDVNGFVVIFLRKDRSAKLQRIFNHVTQPNAIKIITEPSLIIDALLTRDSRFVLGASTIFQIDRPGFSGTVTGNVVAELGVSFKTKRCNGQNDEEHRHDGKYLKIIKE